MGDHFRAFPPQEQRGPEGLVLTKVRTISNRVRNSKSGNVTAEPMLPLHYAAFCDVNQINQYIHRIFWKFALETTDKSFLREEGQSVSTILTPYQIHDMQIFSPSQ